MKTPNLSEDFPLIDQSLKIKPHPDSTAHGGSHFDVLQVVEGGTDQIRLSPEGDVLGGATNIGKAKMSW